MQFLKKQTTKDRYGNETTYEFENQVKPLDQTEIMKMMMEQGVPQMPQGIPQMPIQQQAQQGHPGGPKGTDTVPAWLTPGEFVMNAKAVDKFGPQIEAMNNEGREEQNAQVPQMGGQEAQYHAAGGEVTPEYIPDAGEIARYQAALNEVRDNATSSARVAAAFKDGEFRNAVAPEVQYEVPSMLDRVPQDPSQAKSFTNIGEEAIGPIPTVPAQAEVPTESSSIMGFLQPAIDNAKADGAAIYGGVNYNPRGVQGDDTGVDATSGVDDPFATYKREPKTKVEGDAKDKNLNESYMNGKITLDELNTGKANVEADKFIKLRDDEAAIVKESEDIQSQINLANTANLPTEDLEDQLAKLKDDEVKAAEAININKGIQEQIKQDPEAYEDMGGLTVEDSDALIAAGKKVNGFPLYDKNLSLASGNSGVPKVDAPPTSWYDSAFDALKKAGGNLLSPDRLAEATLMYLGSRAMGYGHAGSLGFVSKQYLGGIKADQAAVRAAAADKSKRALDMKDFGNKELIKTKLAAAAKGIANGQIKVDRTKLITIADTNGKKRKVYAAVDGAGNKSYTDTNGKPIDTAGYETEQSNIKDTPEYRNRVETTSKSFAKVFKELEDREGSFDDEGNVTYTTGIIPGVAGREAVDWAVKNGVPQEEIGGLLQSAYMDAINFSKASGTTPKDIKPFLNQLVIRHKAGASVDLFALKTDDKKAPKQYVDASKLANVNAAIAKTLKDKGVDAKVSDIASQYYDSVVPAWNKLSPTVREKWESRANDGENGFYVFIANRLGIDERKVK